MASASQHLADVAVAQLGIGFGQHADAQPVFGLRVDGAAQRAARYPKVLVHLVGDFHYAHDCMFDI
eukprot:gene30102-37262_t